MHVLDADGPAVGLAQGGEQLAQRGPRQAEERAGVEGAVEVGLGQAELGTVPGSGCVGRRLAERVEVGEEVAEVAVGVDEADDAELGGGVGGRGRGTFGQLEALEEGPPQVVHRGRVGLPALIGVVNRVQVPAGRKRRVHGEGRLRRRSVRPVIVSRPPGRGKQGKTAVDLVRCSGRGRSGADCPKSRYPGFAADGIRRRPSTGVALAVTIIGGAIQPRPAVSTMIPIRYFKRYRMVLDLGRPLPPVPVLARRLFLAAVGRWPGRRPRPGEVRELSRRNRQPSVSEPRHRDRLRTTDAGDPPQARLPAGSDLAARLRPGLLRHGAGRPRAVRLRRHPESRRRRRPTAAAGLGTALLLQALHGFRRARPAGGGPGSDGRERGRRAHLSPARASAAARPFTRRSRRAIYRVGRRRAGGSVECVSRVASRATRAPLAANERGTHVPQDVYQHTFPNGLTLLAERMEHVRSAAPQLPGARPAASTIRRTQLGLGSVLADLITRGAGDRDSRELTLALDNLGLDRDESVGSLHMRFWGATLARNLPAALEIYADILRRPHLPDDEIDAVQALALQDLQGLEDEPRQKVLIELRKRHYPAPLGQRPPRHRRGHREP